jgi:hypothetical protein
MHLPEPARAHDLREGTRVITIGLVWHRLHRRVGLTRLDADCRQSGTLQFVIQPGCQRAGFKADALHWQADFAQRRNHSLRLALRTHFLHHPARVIDNADRRVLTSSKVQPPLGADPNHPIC